MAHTKSGLILLMAMVLVAGCAEKRPPAELLNRPADVTTPQALITAMAKAVAGNDRDAYLANHVFAGPETRTMVTDFFVTIQTAQKYANKCRRAFGDEAADRYCGRTLRDVIVATNAEDCEYVIDGDTAVVTHPIAEMNMVRIDGVWKMEYRDYDTPEELERVRAQSRMYKATAAVYRQLIAEMVEPGMTPEELNERKKAMMAGIYNPKPHIDAVANE